MSDRRQAALWMAAELDFPVFPIFEMQNGACSCGKASCEHAGKHPRTRHGLKDATTDPDQIREWWSEWPDANVAVRTGDDLVVLDIDGKEGEKSIHGLVQKHGKLANRYAIELQLRVTYLEEAGHWPEEA